ncbi:MAG: acyl carrier protein [Syntrophobacteraceae bacterium]|jgi:acyl carrier protein
MSKDEFYAHLESILELEPNTIHGAENLKDLDGWDSLAKISFIAMGDVELGVIVSATGLLACKTVGDLVRLFNGIIV